MLSTQLVSCEGHRSRDWLWPLSECEYPVPAGLLHTATLACTGLRGADLSRLGSQDPLDPTRSVIVIRSLVADGVAERSGALLPGDRLVSVNEYSLEDASLADAVEVLKAVPPGTVQLGICKPLVVSAAWLMWK